KAMRGAGEPAIREQRNAVAEAFADESSGDAEHLAHSRAALRSLVANDHDIAGVDLVRRDGGERIFFALEHAGRPAVQHALVTGDLEDTAFGRQVALENYQATRRL